jgi:DNA-binding transcriptional ArsR family regulator
MDAPFANWLRVVWPLLCKNLLMRADSQSESVGRMEQADDQLVELAVEIFKMLADATRVRIVLALRDGESSVNTLADVVGKSPAAVSQHLAKLRLARMVTTRHEGTACSTGWRTSMLTSWWRVRSSRPSTPSRTSRSITGNRSGRCGRDLPTSARSPSPRAQPQASNGNLGFSLWPVCAAYP